MCSPYDYANVIEHINDWSTGRLSNIAEKMKTLITWFENNDELKG